MTDTPMIERMARAMNLKQDSLPTFRNEDGNLMLDTIHISGVNLTAMAKAALTALQDPTPEMVEAGEGLVRQNNSRWIYAHEVEMDRVFTAMIKAIQGGSDVETN